MFDLREYIESTVTRVLESGTYRDIDYVIAMGPQSINGYVSLPDNHPWIDVDNDIQGFSGVHGGITFHVGNVVGFDTAHGSLGDGIHPESETGIRAEEMVEIFNENSTYRDEDYVRQEIKVIIDDVIESMK